MDESHAPELLLEMSELARRCGSGLPQWGSNENDNGEPLRVYWTGDPVVWSETLIGRDIPGGFPGLWQTCAAEAAAWPPDYAGLRTQHLHWRSLLTASYVWVGNWDRAIHDWNADGHFAGHELVTEFSDAAELSDRLFQASEGWGWFRRRIHRAKR